MNAASVDRFSEVEAQTFVALTCFKTGPPRAVGIELEWLLNHRDDPAPPVSPRPISRSPRGRRRTCEHSRLTGEPGGQVELSSEPFADRRPPASMPSGPI